MWVDEDESTSREQHAFTSDKWYVLEVCSFWGVDYNIDVSCNGDQIQIMAGNFKMINLGQSKVGIIKIHIILRNTEKTVIRFRYIFSSIDLLKYILQYIMLFSTNILRSLMTSISSLNDGIHVF